jgi:hypothetical protein
MGEAIVDLIAGAVVTGRAADGDAHGGGCLECFVDGLDGL